MKPLPETLAATERRGPFTAVTLTLPTFDLVRAEDLARVRVLDLLADAVDRELVAFLDAALGARVDVERRAVHVRDLADDAGRVAVAAHPRRLDVGLPERRRELLARRAG